jgi:iron complex outermembrane receptor protein
LTNLGAPAVGPETLDAYEVGIKSEFLDHSIRLNAAAFYYKYKGVQLTTTQVGVTSYFNAAEGRIKGGEAELTLAPRVSFGDLLINAGLSYLNAFYDSFPRGQITTPNPAGGNIQTLGDLSGNRMIRSPKWTATLGVDYSIPVGVNELGLDVSYYYNDGFFWDPDNRLAQPAYKLLNAEISYGFGPEKRYRVRAFGKNLTNQLYYFYVAGATLVDVAQAADPRTYGIGFDVKFH